MDSLRPSHVIAGKYRLLELLGEGGMGAVWIAENVVLEKRVALKVMSAACAGNEESVERFLREAITASRVRHPAIVAVHDAGVDAGMPWIAMELLPGESLAQRIARRPLTLTEVTTLLLPIVDALGALHAAGIVHRDLKPDNIFLEQCADGTVLPKLLDFGIAKQIAISGLTKTGELIGTGHYLSPEQARGARDVDARSDLYAMGVVLYESLSGTTPFEAETLTELIAKLFTESPRPLRALAPSVPEEVACVVHRCLSREPAARPRDAATLRDQLVMALVRGAIRGSSAPARPAPRALPLRPTARMTTPTPLPIVRARRARSPIPSPGQVFALGLIAIAAFFACAFVDGTLRVGGHALAATREPAPVVAPAAPRATPARATREPNQARRTITPTTPQLSPPPSTAEARFQGEPHVRTGEIAVRGLVSRELVRRVVRADLPALTQCYARALDRDASLEGRVELALTIDVDGSTEAIVAAATTHDAGLEACLVARARHWRMRRAGPAEVVYALVFDTTESR